MFSPTLMEKVAQEQRFDRMRKAEVNRLLKDSQTNGSLKLKLSVVLSGVAVIALMIVQIV